MKKIALALALAAAPFLANASEANGIGYNYVQLDYLYQDGDGLYPNGGVLSGSYSFNDNIFATASYGESSDTVFHTRYKNESWSLGLGLNAAIGSRADWVSQIAYVDSDLSIRAHDSFWHCSPDCRDGENLRGGKISTGVMGRITDQLTANAYLGYEDYDHGYEGNYFADFGVVYAFNKTWGLHAGLNLAEGVDTYTVGVRASF
ncbi:hypothetical protein [Lysobacter arvi]|uniref:Outer membrane protein beta-barrel domain-containing protein n=1 Tax=Lysobacter arvi TaxID=3038776 RepID=A0ABU1CDU7_9GAMM|nr:hypothetical protein [Lysobacter arvi]MDR0183351.1 hypothetical protein [Lysobacter arvi]